MHPLARTPEEWSKDAVVLGGRAFHGKQIFRWLQARGVTDPAQMTDLPAALREKLDVRMPAEISHEKRSTDSTRKLLVRLHDGASVESVLIPELPRRRGFLPSPFEEAEAAQSDDEDEEDDDGPTRVTQCSSTQVGCAMGCVFCASGVAGLKRNLEPEEIVAQVILGRSRLDENEQLRNVVYMGMGEPLANYDATVRSVRLLTHPDGIGLSTRKVTISTSGLVPQIRKLGEDFDGQIGLAISMHAADDETRTRLMPINKKYPLAELISALRAYPLPKRRRITIEYTLVEGKNTSVDEAKKLVKLLRGIPVKVNLIPMNPIAASTLGPPSMDGVLAFQKTIVQAGLSCFIRRQRGDDVAAACGQLALAGAKPKVRVDRT